MTSHRCHSFSLNVIPASLAASTDAWLAGLRQGKTDLRKVEEVVSGFDRFE